MTDINETVTETKKNHFGSREHRIEQLGLLADRVKNSQEVFAGTGVSNMLEEAGEAIADAIVEAKALAADWKPAGRTVVRKAKFVAEVGAAVRIRDKKRAKYAPLFTDAEMDALTVAGIDGKRAVVKAASGAATLIPMSQLSPAKQAAETAKQAAETAKQAAETAK